MLHHSQVVFFFLVDVEEEKVDRTKVFTRFKMLVAVEGCEASFFFFMK